MSDIRTTGNNIFLQNTKTNQQTEEQGKGIMAQIQQGQKMAVEEIQKGMFRAAEALTSGVRQAIQDANGAKVRFLFTKLVGAAPYVGSILAKGAEVAFTKKQNKLTALQHTDELMTAIGTYQEYFEKYYEIYKNHANAMATGVTTDAAVLDWRIVGFQQALAENFKLRARAKLKDVRDELIFLETEITKIDRQYELTTQQVEIFVKFNMPKSGIETAGNQQITRERGQAFTTGGNSQNPMSNRFSPSAKPSDRPPSFHPAPFKPVKKP